GSVVTRSAGLRDMDGMIETGARHPVLCQPDGRNLPLIESGIAHHAGDVVTVDAAPLLEQLTSHRQRLAVGPVARAALLVDGHLPGLLPGAAQPVRLRAYRR